MARVCWACQRVPHAEPLGAPRPQWSLDERANEEVQAEHDCSVGREAFVLETKVLPSGLGPAGGGGEGVLGPGTVPLVLVPEVHTGGSREFTWSERAIKVFP